MTGISYPAPVQRYHLWDTNLKAYVRIVNPSTRQPEAFTDDLKQAGVYVWGQVYETPMLASLVKQGTLEVIPCGLSKNQQRSIYEQA